MLKPGHWVDGWKANLHFSHSPWLVISINIWTHGFKNIYGCWHIDTSFVERAAMLMTPVIKRMWQKNTVCVGTCHPLSLGSQPPGDMLKELEPGTDRTHMGVPANRQCHVRHLKKPQGWAFRSVGILIDSEKELPSALCAEPPCSTTQLFTASQVFSGLIHIKWSRQISVSYSLLPSSNCNPPHIISLDSQNREMA